MIGFRVMSSPLATSPDVVSSRHWLSAGTLTAAALAVAVAQIGLSIPAVLNGMIQQDLGTTSTQLTWVSDALLVPITLFELTFGVVGDLFGRKRLLAIGALLMVAGATLAFFTPGPETSHGLRVGILFAGQAIAGLGAAAIFPTSISMLAAGTHTVKARSQAISVWAAALTGAGFISPVIAGALARVPHSGGPDASWRWAFLFLACIALVSAVVTTVAATNSSSPIGRSLDWPGQITIAVSLFALLFAVIQGSTWGWSNTWVVTGFVVAVLFFAAFIAVERRAPAPLLRLDLFRNRAFSVNSLITVVGMFAFLGTAYSTSIRLAAIQDFSPMQTAVAFVLLQGFTLVLMPVTAKVIRDYNPRWPLGAGFLLIGAGDLWIATRSAAHLSLWPIVAPLVLIGIGFAFALSGVTAVAVNTVPGHLAGMAAGTTSQLRDFGFTLGPAVIGAIALSRAAAEIQNKLAANPTLQSALDAFGHQAPPAVVGAVHSGPLGANAIPGNPLKEVAFAALDHAYAMGYVVCGIAALAAAVLAAGGLRGTANRPLVTEESLRD